MGQFYVMEVLHQAGADAKATDKDGLQCIHYAAGMCICLVYIYIIICSFLNTL